MAGCARGSRCARRPRARPRDLVELEQARTNGCVTEIDQPDVGRLRMVGNPVQLGDTPLDATRPAPELSQHTEEVLLEAGLDWDAIAALREKGTI